jgi:hypothetical protein
MSDGKGYPRGWNFLLSRTLNLGPSATLSVSPTSTSRTAIPLQRPDEPGEVPGIWTRSSFLFVVKPDGLMGRFQFEYDHDIKDGRISQFNVQSSPEGEGTSSATRVFTSEFTQKLIKAAFRLSTMQGRWTPPGGAIYLKDGKVQRASSRGHFVPLRADYRKPRVGERHWEDTDEIDRIVSLQKRADQLLRSNNLMESRLNRPRSASQADIERWIAEQTGVWSPGTVHRQLQIARHKGKIKPKKRGRKKST